MTKRLFADFRSTRQSDCVLFRNLLFGGSRPSKTLLSFNNKRKHFFLLGTTPQSPIPTMMQTTTTNTDHEATSTSKMRQQPQHQIRLGISLDGTLGLRETTEQVYRMKTVEKVDIYVDKSFRKGTSEEFASLMEAIGSLPKIISLQIRSSSFSGHWAQLPFSTLETVIESSKHSLKYLHLSQVDFTFPQDEECSCPLTELARLMEYNTNLKEVRINYGGFKISRSALHALMHMLQYKNYSLETLDFDCRTLRYISKQRRERMQFYLTLNRSGLRQKLLDPKANATSREWVDAVISNREQSSMVFYLLSNNPSMICV